MKYIHEAIAVRASASDLKYQRRYLWATFITVFISIINLIIYMKTLPMTQKKDILSFVERQMIK